MKTASLLCPLLLASFACAQTVDTPAETPNPASPIKVGDVTLTGTLRDRVYVWNWFQAATGANQYAYSGNYLRLNLAESFSAWDWDAEFTVPFLLGLPATAVDAAPQGALGLGANYYSANGNRRNPAMIFPRQWYVRFHGLGGSDASKLQVGRFLFKDGSELTPRSTTLATLKRDRVSERLLGFRFLGCRAQLRRRALLVHYFFEWCHVCGGGSDARRISSRRMGLEQGRLRLCCVCARLGHRPTHVSSCWNTTTGVTF
jgi:hypothetical protein